jgi:hypothetical protein
MNTNLPSMLPVRAGIKRMNIWNLEEKYSRILKLSKRLATLQTFSFPDIPYKLDSKLNYKFTSLKMTGTVGGTSIQINNRHCDISDIYY